MDNYSLPQLEGSELVQAQAQGETSHAGAERNAQKIFLGGLAWDTNEAKLKEYFSKFGAIEDVIVIRDRITNRPRGFGFITFQDQNVAELVLVQKHMLDGRRIEAKPSVPHTPKTKKIFVGGLAPETTQDEFKAHFQQFGQVVEAQIMLDHVSGRSRGFGFVTFDMEEAVEKVLKFGSIHQIANKRCEVKNATPKGSGPVGVRPDFPGTNIAGGRGYFPRGGYQGHPVPPGMGMYPPMPVMPPGYGYPGYPYPYPGMYMPGMGQFSYPAVPQYYPGARAFPGGVSQPSGSNGQQSSQGGQPPGSGPRGSSQPAMHGGPGYQQGGQSGRGPRR